MKIGGRYITAYEPGMALEVCEKIAEGMNLCDVLKIDGMPAHTTWYRWMMIYPELKSAYETARQISAEGMEEKLLKLAKDLIRLEIASSPHDLDRVKTGMAQLRWSAARRNPALFGDQQKVTTVVPIQINTSLSMGEGAVEIEAGSVYTIRAIKPTAEPSSEEAEPAGVMEKEEKKMPEAWAPAPSRQASRRHKTAKGIVATKAAWAHRGVKRRDRRREKE